MCVKVYHSVAPLRFAQDNFVSWTLTDSLPSATLDILAPLRCPFVACCSCSSRHEPRRKHGRTYSCDQRPSQSKVVFALLGALQGGLCPGRSPTRVRRKNGRTYSCDQRPPITSSLAYCLRLRLRQTLAEPPEEVSFFSVAPLRFAQGNFVSWALIACRSQASLATTNLS